MRCAAGSTLAAGLALVVVAVLSLVEPADHAVKEIKLPLRHEDIIRQQAADKNVDASLIAAVIYTESRFRDQTSHAGAKGLMQLMPETADYIARKSGGTRFERGRSRDAADQHRVRHLVPALPADKYDGNTILTLAAYNAGEGKVDEWRRAASAAARRFRVADHIPFKETRDYVGACSPRARTTAATTRASSRWNESARRNNRTAPASWGYRRHRPHIRPRHHLRRLPHRVRRRPRRHGHRLPRDAARARAGRSR